MAIKKVFYLFIFIAFFSCSEDNDITTPRNLQEYIDANSNRELDEVIACAANADANLSLSYIFYYPITGASQVRYYETDGVDVDENDFSNYRRQILTETTVFGGKLSRFSRSSETESWCIVTYLTNGKLHKSNPIRLKNATKPTTWSSEVTIEYPSTTIPKFTWSDFGVTDNKIYFEVISDTENDEFLSGTYTNNKVYKYQDNSNVVLDINENTTTANLVEDTEYLFTMMAVSEDNWVNVVIQKAFIPRNLQEYLTYNSSKTIDSATAFAASSSASQSLSYIYFYPKTGATEIRYYEAESTITDQNNFANYRRVNLTNAAVYGGKLRRFSRTDSTEGWCIVTYVIDNILYKSAPIKIKNQTKPTEWLTDVTINYPQTLLPKFTWTDGKYVENTKYFQLISDVDNLFLSGTFTTEKTFQYNNASNVTSTINVTTPVNLILDDEYKFTLMGLSSDNWVNLVIQKSFTVE